MEVKRFLTAKKAEQTAQEAAMGVRTVLVGFDNQCFFSIFIVFSWIKTLHQIEKFESLTTITLIYIAFKLALNIGEN